MWIMPIMAPKQKQTLNEEGRIFNEEWGGAILSCA